MMTDVLGRIRYERSRRRIQRRLRGEQGKPVVVYTIGKTGSSTVLATVGRALPERPARQIHHLQPHRIARSDDSYRRQDRPRASVHVEVAKHMLRHQPPTPDEPWDVITLVREPVAQDVSVFFQVGERRGFMRIDDDGALIEPGSIDELHERFATWRDHEDDARWFDEDLLPSLGIDVYATPFDHAAGFARIDGERARLLLLRNEDLHRVGSRAIGDFLGIEPPELVAANVGAEKRYADVYAAFRSRGVPASLVNTLHATKLARHFYTPDELATARATWAR